MSELLFRIVTHFTQNIPTGEYTAYAVADYGNQRFFWVKHLTVVKGRAKLMLTNDATCKIFAL